MGLLTPSHFLFFFYLSPVLVCVLPLWPSPFSVEQLSDHDHDLVMSVLCLKISVTPILLG